MQFAPEVARPQAIVDILVELASLSSERVLIVVFRMLVSCGSASSDPTALIKVFTRLFVYTEHLVAHNFLMRTVCQVVLSGSHPSLTFHAFAWLKMKQCAISKTVHTSRSMSYTTSEMTSTCSTCTGTPSFPSARPTSISSTVHSSEMNPCHDPQQVSIGYMADLPPTAGYEPKDLAGNDDLCVKPLFFHRPSTTSTYDSVESIATLPHASDLDDEQIRALLASPLYLQEREASADRSQVYHPARENLVSSSSQVPKSTWKPVALFSSKRKWSQEAISDREDCSSEHQQVPGSNEPPLRFSNPENSINHSLKSTEIFCLQKQNLKCESKKAEQIFSTVPFVIFRDNLIPIVWKSVVPTQALKNIEKSRPDFMKNELSDKEHFEKLR